MAFHPSTRSNKTGECRRIAKHIADAAQAMGLVATLDKSRVSASHYVIVSQSKEDEGIKIRISDHDDKHGGSDWYCWAGDCPSQIIRRIADHFGRFVPQGYRPSDYALRSQSALKAAETRREGKASDEAEMLSEIQSRLSTAPSASKVAAGKIIDALYPGIARAQRQRLAEAASVEVTFKRTLATAIAASDTATLAKLIVQNALERKHAAQAALYDLVGAEQYTALRPERYPKAAWAYTPVSEQTPAPRR
jgi:hypothetical protein